MVFFGGAEGGAVGGGRAFWGGRGLATITLFYTSYRKF